jgi:hypothetical protein
VDYLSLYYMDMNSLTQQDQSRVSDTLYLQFCDEALREVAKETKYNKERLRGQTVVGQEEYDFPRMIDVWSFRAGVTWDGDDCTFQGYELCDSCDTFKLSVRTEAARVRKSELGVS